MDLVGQDERLNAADTAVALRAELVASGWSHVEQQRQQLENARKAEKAEKDRQDNARDARALARSQRKKDLPLLAGLDQELSQVVINAGDPGTNESYSDDCIESYYTIFRQIQARNKDDQWLRFHRPDTFFEPPPPPNGTVTTLSSIRNPAKQEDVIFTGVIHLGSSTSDMFFSILRRYLAALARTERSRRQ